MSEIEQEFEEAANDDKIHFDTIEAAIGYYVNNSGRELKYTEVLRELYKKDQEIERLKLAMSEIENE